MKQQQNVSRLVQFLLSLMQPSSTNHHHHTKHHRMGAGVNGQPKAKILVPVEEENPLALVGSSNWDVLGAIQSGTEIQTFIKPSFHVCLQIL